MTARVSIQTKARLSYPITLAMIVSLLLVAQYFVCHLMRGQAAASGHMDLLPLVAQACLTLVGALGSSLFVGRHLRRTLHEEQTAANSILNAIPDGVMTIQGDGTICSMNPTAELVFGYKAEDLIGQNVSVLMPEPFASQHDEAIKHYHNHGSFVIGSEREILGLRADGSTFPLDITVSAMPAGGPAHFVGIMRDATESRAASSKLEEALEEAREATRCKGDFLANVSHEIRTPMTAIIGYGELLALDDLSKAEAQEAAEAILRSGKHLLSLISDVLDFSKIDAGKFEIEVMRASPFAIVEGVFDIMHGQALQKGLELNVDYICNLPATVQTDPTKLRQALINLVGNAIKFTEEGSVCITVSTIQGAEQDCESHLCFEVTDTGAGIAPEVLEHLFSPFVQADSSVTRKFGGTGLGLSISKEIAQGLGGNLWVISVLGKGSCFCLTVKVGQTQFAEHISIDDWNSSRPLPKPLAPVCDEDLAISVLLVEDDPVNRTILKRMLKGTGVQISEAVNGREAVDLALRAMAKGQTFDLILMDMQMPVLDGLAATRELRDADYVGPIVALTANSTKDARDKSTAAGCTDFATKPIARDRLIQLVSAHGGKPLRRVS